MRREREREQTFHSPRKPHNMWGANRPGGLTRPLCPGEEEEEREREREREGESERFLKRERAANHPAMPGGHGNQYRQRFSTRELAQAGRVEQ